MKKRIFFILLTMLLIFAGCGKKKEQAVQKEQKEVKASDTAEETATTEEKTDSKAEEVEKKPIVDVQYSDEGVFEIHYDEENSYEYEYKYSIPMITDESNTAKRINHEIFSLAKESIDTVQDIKDEKPDVYEPNFSSIEYEAYENGDIVSIVVTCHGIFSEWREIYTFNYNKATQNVADNAELLKACNMSEEDFVSQAGKTLGNLALYNLDEYFDASEGEKEDPDSEDWKKRMIPDFILNYLSTISEDNVNKDMETYIDGDGNLCVIGLVYVPAGAGQYYTAAKVEDVNVDEIIKKYVNYSETYHFPEFEKNCMRLYETEGLSTQLSHKVASGNQYNEEVYLGFDSVDPSKFLVQYYGDGYSICYSGKVKWTGADENGLIFEYVLSDQDGEQLMGDDKLSGKFYLNPYSKWDDNLENLDAGAKYLYIEGDDLMDSQGKTIDLKKSFG